MNKLEFHKVVEETAFETITKNPEIFENAIKKVCERMCKLEGFENPNLDKLKDVLIKLTKSDESSEIVGQIVSDILQSVIVLCTINTMTSFNKLGLLPDTFNVTKQ